MASIWLDCLTYITISGSQKIITTLLFNYNLIEYTVHLLRQPQYWDKWVLGVNTHQFTSQTWIQDKWRLIPKLIDCKSCLLTVQATSHRCTIDLAFLPPDMVCVKTGSFLDTFSKISLGSCKQIQQKTKPIAVKYRMVCIYHKFTSMLCLTQVWFHYLMEN